jgi:hypothetical protein
VPKEELQSADRAKGWFDRAQVGGVVAFRAINDDRAAHHQPATWTTSYYQSFWHHGNSWSAVYEPGYVRNERFVSLETVILDVPGNALVWAGEHDREPQERAGGRDRGSRKRSRRCRSRACRRADEIEIAGQFTYAVNGLRLPPRETRHDWLSRWLTLNRPCYTRDAAAFSSPMR